MQIWLEGNGLDSEKGELIALASSGDLGRARDLISDSGVLDRYRIWSTIPERLAPTGYVIAAAVEEMLSHALAIASSLGNTFTALDVGCGNGWVVRKMAGHPHCSLAVGIDAAPSMIDKAKKLDSENQYHLVDIMQWTTEHSFDLIHSMETMYYLEDPVKGIQRLSEWLK